MCGIAGIISSEGFSQNRDREMLDSLRHRGPEEEGIHTSAAGHATLLHKRLCIIDLSQEAAQPFQYLHYHIIHNGELFNYLELRETLKKQGFQFRTGSDTEVIVAAYAAYGSDCLQHFNGMFAFAIWDEERQELFAARDRMGEKPLFYSCSGGKLIFASEMKALWAAGVPREVNPAMVYNFLTIDYTSNPGDPSETFFQHIYRLPAACLLVYSPREDKLRIEKYWQVYNGDTIDITDHQAIERMGELLSSAVSLRMRSDVPVGTSLSGGLDSSSVVAFCEAMPGRQYSHKSFTAGFPGFEKDESAHARKVAEHFHLDSQFSTIDASEVEALMEEMMYFQEEPVLSASPLVQYRLYQTAKRKGVTVLLDGQGADEQLGGYSKYFKWYWQQLYRQGKLGKTGELQKARALGNEEGFGWSNKLVALFPDFTASLQQTRKAKKAARSSYLSETFRGEQRRNSYYTLPADLSLDGQLHFNSFTYGLEELLRMADRNSMAHAAEVRLPFLDHRLVEFVFSLPANMKIRDGWSKWLLRKTVEDKLPQEITWRKDKIGFEPPQKQWMEHPGVEAAITRGKKLLVDNGILDLSILKKRVHPHHAHAADNLDWKCWSLSYLFKPS